MNSTIGSKRPHLWYPGWNLVGATLLSQIFSIGLTINCLTLFLGTWSQEFSVPNSSILLAIIPVILISGLFSPPLGVWADKYPARWIFGAGLVGMALCFIGISWATEVWHIWAIYALTPFPAVACGILPASALISRWFVKRAALAQSIMAFGQGAAGMVVPPLVAFALPALGWRDVWFYSGIITLIATGPIVYFLRDRPTERDGLEYTTGAAGTAGAGGHGHGGGGDSDLKWGDIFRSRNFWLLLVFFLPILSVYLGVQQNLGPLVARLGLATTVAGTLVGIYGTAHAVATLLAGVVSERIGNRRAMAGLALCACAGVLVIAFSHSFPLLVVGAIMCGAGGGMWPLLPVAAAAEFGPSGVGRAFGAIFMVTPLSAAVPSLVAKANESTGSYAPALVTLALACVVSAVAAMMMRPGAAAHPDPATA